ncbi:MAG: hypothetical protein JO354_03865 [Verrucomicrobia bacterium]|nr:hypothetical protein [Verrucomicrobiota bacterium]
MATLLAGWENFYVIVGSSAGALIGLQFVVVTLMAELPIPRDAAYASGAFSTPSVVHFTIVLFLSALISAPWRGIAILAVAWALVGVSGVLYSAIVALRLRQQTAYQPVMADWLSYVFLPLVGYVMLATSGLLAFSHTGPAMFLVAAATLLLLFVGIHNAWDTVTYHVFVQRRKSEAAVNR